MISIPKKTLRFHLINSSLKALLVTLCIFFTAVSYGQEKKLKGPGLSSGALSHLEAISGKRNQMNPRSNDIRLNGPVMVSNAVSDLEFSFDAITALTELVRDGYTRVPPDPSGAAGPDHLVNVVNSAIEWYTKAGVLLHSEALSTFFDPVTSLPFDPKVLYDQYADRFVVVALDTDFNSYSEIYLAVSQTSNPEDGWYFHKFNSVVNISGNDTYADYPGLAVDEEAIYVTNNMFGPSFAGPRLWIIPKLGFYTGGVATSPVYDPTNGGGASFGTMQPAHVFGDVAPGVGTYLTEYLVDEGGPNDFVRTIKISDPLGTPVFTINSVDVGDLSTNPFSNQFIPQMGSTMTIRSNDSRMLNAVWRNNQLAVCFKIQGDGSGGNLSNQSTAHWVLLNDNNAGVPTLIDQGNVFGDDIAAETSTFYPTVALNKDNTLAIGFSASGPNIFPGAYYTGRRLTDPAGTVGPSKILREGVTSYDSGAERWGDYTGISVDPANDDCFWVYNEYANTPDMNAFSNWGTAFGKFVIVLQAEITGRDSTICSGSTVDLASLLTGTVRGTLKYGDAVGNYNIPNSMVMPTSDTMFFVLDSVAVDNQDTAKIVITVSPQPSISSASITVCQGDSVDLSTVVIGTPMNRLEYGTVFGTYTAGDSIFVPMSDTTIYVRDSSIVTSCVDTAKIVITVSPQPSISSASITVCQGDSVDLSTVVIGTPLNRLEYGTVFGTYTAGDSIFTPMSDTTIYVRDSSIVTSCVDTAKIVITVAPKPSISGASITVCQGDTVDLSTLVIGMPMNRLEYGTVFGTYTPGDSIFVPMTDTIIYVRDSSIVTSCVDTAKITISIRNDVSCLMNFESAKALRFGDPCDCFDFVAINNVVYFRDTLMVDAPTGQSIVYTSSGGSTGLYDVTGMPLLDMTPFIEVSNGMYELEIFKEAGVQPIGNVLLNGQGPIAIPSEVIEVCERGACPNLIPTIGQWGMLVLSIALFIIGIVAIKQKRLILN